ncbi:hypothetical protein BUALT_Bualt07G0070800 [Buddleja alternifolia]|uniref:Uncharacterized protein n=1 Tax=Buddleja alternifolia TaxID=168488 RepID=A0AAV6XFM8_9LAMI|nr:hypothetical protein BUALT_Bualt07G0070800 [Buddleja alternifolia]
MKSLLREKWSRFCNLIRFSPPPTQASLRDKAIAVAERVSTAKDEDGSKVSCPVCFNVFQTKNDSDLKMTLAVHMSLWHPDDVKLQWEIMQKKDKSIVHLPSLILGVGMVAGLGALIALSAKNHAQHLPHSRRR